MGMSATKTARGTLAVHIADNDTLYAAYMPFLKNGGIFVNLPKEFGSIDEYTMGKEIVFIITLPNMENVFVTGKVVWINHEDVYNGFKRGIGAQFVNDLEDQARTVIERILSSEPKFKDSIARTYTM